MVGLVFAFRYVRLNPRAGIEHACELTPLVHKIWRGWFEVRLRQRIAERTMRHTEHDTSIVDANISNGSNPTCPKLMRLSDRFTAMRLLQVR